MFAAAAEAGHDGANGNVQNFGGIFIRELLDVDQKHDAAKVGWNFVHRGEDLLVGEVFRDGSGVGEVGLKELLVFLEEREAEPLAAMVVDAVKQDFEKLLLQFHFLELHQIVRFFEIKLRKSPHNAVW